MGIYLGYLNSNATSDTLTGAGPLARVEIKLKPYVFLYIVSVRYYSKYSYS